MSEWRSSLALPAVSLVSVNFTDLGVDFLELLLRFHWLSPVDGCEKNGIDRQGDHVWVAAALLTFWGISLLINLFRL